MDYRATFLLSDDKIEFCLKKLKSFKTSRVFSPLILPDVTNYLFIFALFGYDNYTKTFIIYIIFSALITIGVYFITTAAIKRYGNIVTKIFMYDNEIFEITCLSDNSYEIQR